MQCAPSLVPVLSVLLAALGLLLLWFHSRSPSRYGKHEEPPPGRAGEHEGDAAAKAEGKRRRAHLPARCAWCLQELPSLLVPALLLALSSPPRLAPLGRWLLGCLFCGHYFHR